MSRGRAAVLLVVLCGLSALAIPSLASARIAYVTGSGIYNSHVAPVDLATGIFGGEIPIAGEGSPQDVAIIPNGKTAYVTGNGNVLPIDVATNTAGTPISIGIQSCPSAIATKPDGTRVYVTDSCASSVSVIDVATGTELTDVPVGNGPDGIAVTPDGTRALVTSFSAETVTPIDLATNTAGTPIPVGDTAQGIAVTPNGAAAYVVVRNDDAVRRIDLATNTVGPVIPVAGLPEEIAIGPDSSRAYVLGGTAPVTPIDLLTDTPGATIPIGVSTFLEDVAVTPDGARAWVTDESDNRLVPIEIPANTLGTPIPGLGAPSAIAIVPNQGPHAAFSSSPSPVLRGDAVSFDAGASVDTDGGSIARYEWDFGDGGDPVVAGPNPQHTYSFGGTYTVTLTVTDNEGCSLVVVFPGQTAHCNGSSLARVSHQVQVTPKCIEVTGSASSFVPKYRAARVVPGVRLRLAASDPARLTVDATMSWSRGGGGSFEFKQLVTNVQHWRRVRFVIPSALRSKLPLGLPVALKLRIEAAPLDETLCPGKAVKKTLHLRVVKVIPGSVQAGRK